MKNKINSVTFILMTVFVFIFWSDNSNAQGRDNCNATGNGKFNFSVAPAIGITVTHDWTLEPICPGCERTWNCEEGDYFLEFIVSGSTECLWDWNSPLDGYTNLVQTEGDQNAWLEGCWYILARLPSTDPRNWVAVPIGLEGQGEPFLATEGGMGIGGIRYYITHQVANCDAAGTYSYTVTVNANYVCSTVQ